MKLLTSLWPLWPAGEQASRWMLFPPFLPTLTFKYINITTKSPDTQIWLIVISTGNCTGLCIVTILCLSPLRNPAFSMAQGRDSFHCSLHQSGLIKRTATSVCPPSLSHTNKPGHALSSSFPQEAAHPARSSFTKMFLFGPSKPMRKLQHLLPIYTKTMVQ